MVNPLILIKPLIKISLTGAARPKEVPLVRLGIGKAISFTDGPDKLCISLENLIE